MGFNQTLNFEVLEDTFFFSSFPTWDSYLFHPHLLPPQQGIEREEQAAEVLISFSFGIYAELWTTGSVLSLSSPRWAMLLLHPSVIQIYFFLWPSIPSWGERKGTGLRDPGGRGTPFSLSQPEVRSWEARCGTASQHAGVQLGNHICSSPVTCMRGFSPAALKIVTRLTIK